MVKCPRGGKHKPPARLVVMIETLFGTVTHDMNLFSDFEYLYVGLVTDNTASTEIKNCLISRNKTK